MRTVLKFIQRASLVLASARHRSEDHKGAAIGRRRAGRARLAELDQRTLRDIGLESWRSPLGADRSRADE